MKPDFSKNNDGLIPVIVQDAVSNVVLMLGYMNEEALEKTKSTKQVTFYSRSRRQLWTKGETSGNKLALKDILADCDNDTLLIKAIPSGPVCHTGAATCFNENNPSFSLAVLEEVIKDRQENPSSKSYTASLFREGINRIAQKVGEEAVELVIESKDDNSQQFLEESADLLFHYLVLLRAKGHGINDVIELLAARHKP
jgi:phosphoribosyl-ATP pyrophosphohydrolase/phosphoribosyl-AMP cyclohydrolase